MGKYTDMVDELINSPEQEKWLDEIFDDYLTLKKHQMRMIEILRSRETLTFYGVRKSSSQVWDEFFEAKERL